jgi:hypothetical protein
LANITDGLAHGMFSIKAEQPQAALIVAAVNSLPDALDEIEALRKALEDVLPYVEAAGRSGFYDEGGSDETAKIIRAALQTMREGGG